MLKEKNNKVHEKIPAHKENIKETISHSIKSVRNSVLMRLFLGLCAVAPGIAIEGCSPIPITSVNTKIESNDKLQSFNKLFQISQKNILIEYVKIGTYANKIVTAKSNRDLEFKDLSYEEKIQFKTMQEAILTEFKNIYDFFQNENMWTFPKWATTIQLSKDGKSLEMVHPEYLSALNACIIKNGYYLLIHAPVNKKSLLPNLPLSSIEVFNLSQAPESDLTFQSILDKGNH